MPTIIQLEISSKGCEVCNMCSAETFRGKEVRYCELFDEVLKWSCSTIDRCQRCITAEDRPQEIY